MALRDEIVCKRAGETLTGSRRAFLRTAARLGVGAAAASVVAGGRLASGEVAGVAGAASLGAHAAKRGILYGCAVDVRALAADPAYAAVIRDQCRILVAENAMKWGPLRPTVDSFRFDGADALVAFAEANQMKIRGHNLAWHRDNPRWFDGAVTAANAKQMLVSHIETVVGRYAGRMHSWDVVNEAIEVKDGRADGMRNSLWLRLAGDDYIEVAFRTARDADPQVLLTYNDYGIEEETPAAEQKRQAVIGMLRRMVARRVPVDALGVQSHLSALAIPASGDGPAYGAGLMRLVAEARELGLQVFVTEMDVNDRASPANIPFRDATIEVMYKQYLDLILADPAVKAVLTWGITDRYTWLDSEQSRADKQPERPLPFDSDYNAAPAFFAMRDAFDRRSTKLP
jgi:endo-1,4-beta-xylanase